jgi:alpha-tubulin suppressor-like RCC1 family protein
VPTRLDTARWHEVSIGDRHTVGVRADGTLWAWGANDRGQLGDGTLTNRLVPTRIGTASDWRSVSAGVDHTLAVRRDGTLWAWGRNTYGQLGQPVVLSPGVPNRTGTESDWVSISAGSAFSMGVRGNGTLWAWGANNRGQLGDGTTTDRPVPTRLGTASDWRSVSTDANYDTSQGGTQDAHTVAVRHDGTLWAWGDNTWGQLGEGSRTTRPVPTGVGAGTNWREAKAAADHTLALQQDGTLWGWGGNYSYQIGQVVYRQMKGADPLLILPGVATPTPTASGSPAASPLLVWPNPAADHVAVRLVTREPGTLRLLTALGQVVLAEAVSVGGHELVLPTSNLPRGLYLVQLLQRSGSVSERLVLR